MVKTEDKVYTVIGFMLFMIACKYKEKSKYFEFELLSKGYCPKARIMLIIWTMNSTLNQIVW